MRALRTEKNRAEHKTFSAVNWIWGIAAAALMVALIFTVWFTGIRITDPGMSPTLYPGDVVLFDKLSMHLSMPKRGEAYAFRGDAAGAAHRPCGHSRSALHNGMLLQGKIKSGFKPLFCL